MAFIMICVKTQKLLYGLQLNMTKVYGEKAKILVSNTNRVFSEYGQCAHHIKPGYMVTRIVY